MKVKLMIADTLFDTSERVVSMPRLTDATILRELCKLETCSARLDSSRIVYYKVDASGDAAFVAELSDGLVTNLCAGVAVTVTK